MLNAPDTYPRRTPFCASSSEAPADCDAASAALAYPYWLQAIWPLALGGVQVAFKSAFQFAWGQIVVAHWANWPTSVGSTPKNLNRGIEYQTQSGKPP
jgi:hypothetical protein